MSKKVMFRLSVALGLCGVAFLLVGVWWWALLGMTPEVGGAVMATGWSAVCAGVALALGYQEEP